MRLSLAVASVALFMLASPAMGQSKCDKRNNVLKHLAQKYQESPVAVGVTNGGGLVEVLTTGDGKTWTIIVTTPQGMSCLVAAGVGWRQIKAPPDDKYCDVFD